MKNAEIISDKKNFNLPELFTLLQVPVMKIIDDGGYVTCEYSTLYMMYRFPVN